MERGKNGAEEIHGLEGELHHADSHAAYSSDDESTLGDEDVKLLPLKKGRDTKRGKKGPTVTFELPTASSSTLPVCDDSDEPRDVGKAIEQVLERERAMLSESFDTDLEDGESHLILSDDDSDGYGIPGDKVRRKHKVTESRGWKGGLRSILPLKAWWHVFPLIAVALLVMWLALKGLNWMQRKSSPDEYVRTLLPY